VAVADGAELLEGTLDVAGAAEGLGEAGAGVELQLLARKTTVKRTARKTKTSFFTFF
jgi:hypothetical protein